MQTFLPYDEPTNSARVLDNKRLGKQRVEAVQIVRCLLGLSSTGWQNHPAVKMWRSYEPYLIRVYLPAMMREWAERGYKNTKTEQHYTQFLQAIGDEPSVVPWWFDLEELFLSHRSNLIRKKPEFYKPIWPDVPDNLEYVWPVA